MTLLKDNNYKDINIALLSLESDIKNKIVDFDTSIIDKQLEEINKRIDKINAGSGSSNDNSAEINDLRAEIEVINAQVSNNSAEIADINTKLSKIFSAEKYIEDFNTAIEPGIYWWGLETENRPANYGVLLVNRFNSDGNSNWINQTAYSTSGKIYFRQKINDNEWRAWQTIAFEDITKTYTIPDVTTATTRYLKLGTFPWHFSETVKVVLGGNCFEDTVEFNVLGGNSGDANVCGWYTTNNGLTKGIRVVPVKPVTYSSNIEVWLEVVQLTTLTVKLTGNAKAAQYFNTNAQLNNTQTAPSNGKITNFTTGRGFFGQNFDGTARSAKGWQEYVLDLKSLSNSNFYPVVIDTLYMFAEVEIHSEPGSAGLPYNQNRIKFAISSAGWSDVPKSLYISEYNRYQSNEITIGSIGYCTDSDYKAVIWLRGGLYYNCYTMNCASAPSIKTVDTALDTSVVTVGTSYSGGTNTKVNIIFTPETMSSGIYAYNGITSTNINVSNNLTLKNTTGATLSSYGKEPLSIGTGSNLNVGLDQNSIQARSNGAASDLYLNHYGGKVYVNNSKNSSGGLQVEGNTTLQSNSNVGLSSYGKDPLSIGPSSGANIGIDGDDIQARFNGNASSLDLNYYGGLVRINAASLTNGGLLVGGRLNIPTSAPSNPQKGDIWLVL